MNHSTISSVKGRNASIDTNYLFEGDGSHKNTNINMVEQKISKFPHLHEIYELDGNYKNNIIFRGIIKKGQHNVQRISV